VLVYGDHCEICDPRERLSEISAQLSAIRAMRSGIDRHASLVGALIAAGQLQQGIEDTGCPCDELRIFVHRLAAVAVRSWDSRFRDIGELPAPPHSQMPHEVELRLPEGFAFYAVYPESYAEAARRLRLLGDPRVIGIRSIGTTLGAVVAATLNAPPPITVRPFGDPFARQVELPPGVIESGVHYVIVDEGPGLSGSSFGAVADWLEGRGVPLERIAFLPSHGNDLGPHASLAHRARWNRAQRVAAEFDPTFLAERFEMLEPFSIGSPWERRKYLAGSEGQRVLLKFAGLGAIGERKLAMARALHAAGLTPEPLGLVHGFLVERWHDDARPLGVDERPVAEIGRYIGARARLFPAEPSGGATMDELLTMCRRNISLAFGDAGARALAQVTLKAQSPRTRRVRTDNKLDRAKWIRLANGKLLKTDALDHHQAHDLIGCQSIEWDVAGAVTEFDLNADESARLIAATGQAIDFDLLHSYRIAYVAFRLGQARIAGDLTSASASSRSADRYTRTLHLLLEGASLRESAGILV
jgi:hypothetical protein